MLTLGLVRHSDELGFTMQFRGADHFRVMDEGGWSGETIHPDFASLCDDPVSVSRPVTTVMLSASALRFSGWPDLVFQTRNMPDWICAIFTGWDCVEVIVPAPPEISWVNLVPLAGVR